MLSLVITSPKKLPFIMDIIHDCWFQKDEIVFNSDTNTLEVKFMREAMEEKELIGNVLFFKKYKIPFIECYLRIYSVKSYEINDKEQVGGYDFNKLEYDSEKQQISILTGIPIDIKVRVEEFHISIEETNKVIKEKNVFSLFG